MTALYRGMDFDALNKAYNNTWVVADFPAELEKMQQRSQALYEKYPAAQRNIPYASGARSVIDFIPAHDNKAPLYIFIHGGYWHACVKDDFAFVARGALENGYHVALIEYTLTPHVSMTELVAQVRQSLDFIDANTERFKVDREKVCLSGHSAGGHLTAMHRDHPLITHAIPVSALVDMEPMQLCWLNEFLSLTRDELDTLSPIRHMKKGVPTDVAVGGAELPELIRHSREYYQALQNVGNEGIMIEPAGLNHFTLLDDLADSQGFIMKRLKKIFG